MNILVVSAHHDDLELGCGGAIAKFVAAGHRVTSLVMSNSEYKSASGVPIRKKEDAIAEGDRAAEVLGYEVLHIDQDFFNIDVCDENACHILEVLADHEIDTVFTHWHGDSHPPHRNVHRLTMHACRNIPRVLGFEVNWYIAEESFKPQMFVSLSEENWNKKIEALACYKTEFDRAGDRWVSYFDRLSLNYGLRVGGVNRAEAFMVYKYLWDS